MGIFIMNIISIIFYLFRLLLIVIFLFLVGAIATLTLDCLIGNSDGLITIILCLSACFAIFCSLEILAPTKLESHSTAERKENFSKKEEILSKNQSAEFFTTALTK